MFNYNMLIGAIILILLDSMYLSIMNKYYTSQIKSIQQSDAKLRRPPILIVYVLLIIALSYFIIKPKRNVSDAFLLGLIIYGVFNLTNYAMFTNWSVITVLLDSTWGGLLFAITNMIIRFIS